MNKTRFILLTASLVLATTLTLSCEDKETKTEPAVVSGSVNKIMYVNDEKRLISVLIASAYVSKSAGHSPDCD